MATSVSAVPSATAHARHGTTHDFVVDFAYGFCEQNRRSQAAAAASVTLKCIPHEKSAQKEIITELICFSLIETSPVP